MKAHGGVKNLWFIPGKTKGAGKWLFRFVSPITGKRRDMGLGSYPETSILEVSKLGISALELLAKNLDPIDERNAASQSKVPTFEAAAREVHKEQSAGWANQKHIAQWITTLETYVFPTIGKTAVTSLTPKNFADVLRPIWLEKAETASRTKQRCHSVMSWCWAHGLVEANPVDVVDHLLPKQSPTKQHQPAMPWPKIPTYIKEHLVARQDGECTKAALEFLILTAARSGAVRLMSWAEVNLASGVWTIPADEGRKSNVPRRIPLSSRAIELIKLQTAAKLSPDLVFPAPRGGVLSDMTLTALLRRTKAASDTPGRFATAHGFRSAFRDWASEHGYSRDLAERQLSHEVQSKVEAAYHRTDLLDQRRPMMEAWSNFLIGQTKS